MILSNDSLVAFHYRSYGTFFLHKNRLHNIYRGFTHYKYYRTYFDNWIEKANRDSKFFPIFYYFYWVYIPLYALFSLAWTVISVLFFNIVLRNLTDIKLWGIWFLFILLAIGLNRSTYFCLKKMFRLRRELGKSKGGRH